MPANEDNPGQRTQIVVGLDEISDETAIAEKAAAQLGVSPNDVRSVYVLKKSVDARGRRCRFQLSVQVGGDDPLADLGGPLPAAVDGDKPVVIIGAGPAGLFAAYELARRGVRSVVIDRGKEVQPRRRDLKGLNQRGTVDEDSNYCFGEGGAGTYSDGKLYTRAKKRGPVRDVLEILALHGAPREILVDARPHIGSNRLPKVLVAMRERLLACGVSFRFQTRVEDFGIDDGRCTRVFVRKVDDDNGDTSSLEELQARAVVLATGHSARDIYALCAQKNVAIEAKPFALGVRIEHPQPLINAIQYGQDAGHPALPNAPYEQRAEVDERGVFSFCMCPGGFIVPAATERGGVVVNGMSLSRRDSPFANSGLVVAIEVEDVERAGHRGPLGGIAFQRAIEQASATEGGGHLVAPAARVTDFLKRRASTSLPDTSYQPGISPGDLDRVLDAAGHKVAARLRSAFDQFETRMRGYITEEAILVATESRTSAPVRILRDETLQSPTIRGLYPTGEGAGFAGGIVSAALDGQRVAAQIHATLDARIG